MHRFRQKLPLLQAIMILAACTFPSVSTGEELKIQGATVLMHGPLNVKLKQVIFDGQPAETKQVTLWMLTTKKFFYREAGKPGTKTIEARPNILEIEGTQDGKKLTWVFDRDNKGFALFKNGKEVQEVIPQQIIDIRTPPDSNGLKSSDLAFWYLERLYLEMWANPWNRDSVQRELKTLESLAGIDARTAPLIRTLSRYIDAANELDQFIQDKYSQEQRDELAFKNDKANINSLRGIGNLGGLLGLYYADNTRDQFDIASSMLKMNANADKKLAELDSALARLKSENEAEIKRRTSSMFHLKTTTFGSFWDFGNLYYKRPDAEAQKKLYTDLSNAMSRQDHLTLRNLYASFGKEANPFLLSDLMRSTIQAEKNVEKLDSLSLQIDGEFEKIYRKIDNQGLGLVMRLVALRELVFLKLLIAKVQADDDPWSQMYNPNAGYAASLAKQILEIPGITDFATRLRLYSTWAHFLAGQIDAAIDQAETLKALLPKNAEFWLRYSQMLGSRNQPGDVAKALDAVKACIEDAKYPHVKVLRDSRDLFNLRSSPKFAQMVGVTFEVSFYNRNQNRFLFAPVATNTLTNRSSFDLTDVLVIYTVEDTARRVRTTVKDNASIYMLRQGQEMKLSPPTLSRTQRLAKIELQCDQGNAVLGK
ncbi:MAG: hypothetical protein R3B84_18315 [Zavarzinella sp.]